MVFQGLSSETSEIKFISPSIIKPIKLWSGKQVITTILLNVIKIDVPAINVTANAKIGTKTWENNKPRKLKVGELHCQGICLSESEIIIRDGELLCGVLDKNHIGSTSFGLTHCIYELYGGDSSTKLLSALSKVFTCFLQLEGFTLGIKDILVLDTFEKKRSKLITRCRTEGKMAALSALDLGSETTDIQLELKLNEAYAKNYNFKTIIDRKYKLLLDNYNNEINKVCLPRGLVNKFPKNNLQLMVRITLE